MAPTQHNLDLRTAEGDRLTFRLPMLSIDAVRALTGLNEDEIIADIESGKILWAWNLATLGAERRFVRIWDRSVIHWLNPKAYQPEHLEYVLESILPHTQPTLRCVELKRAFNCDSEHVLHLVEDGLLVRVQESIGLRESPSVTRASVERFLTDRRLT